LAGTSRCAGADELAALNTVAAGVDPRRPDGPRWRERDS
jgi:hypothetical protein